MKFLLALIVFWDFTTSAQVIDSAAVPNLFSEVRFNRVINVLAHDSLEGRGTGTKGILSAANYLSDLYRELGLKPVGNDNSYFQYIPMHGSQPLESSKLILYTGEESIPLKLKSDYLLLQSGQQTFVPNPVQMVFVGYGIIAPEFDYNDYQSAEVEDKIAVMMEGEPLSANPDFFEGPSPTVYSYPESKQRIALSRGARGCIILPNKFYTNLDWNARIKEFSFEDVRLAYSSTSNLCVLINPDAAEVIFRGTEYTLRNILDMHSSGKMSSFNLAAQLSFSGEFQERDFIDRNIAGIIEGTDPELKDSYLIISAHYDHLGIGFPINGDSIYNGNFDNAVGCAALIETANAFIQIKNNKRSIIFLLLTGEEKGLLGSIYYNDHPLVPLYKTIADINIDGISSFDEVKNFVGVGSEYSTLELFLRRTAEQMGLYLSAIPPFFNRADAFYRSDQAAFSANGIPSVLIAEGNDYINISDELGEIKFLEYTQTYYHTPFDDLNLKINNNAAAQHIQFILNLAFNLVNSEEEPEWKPGVPFINARLRSIAEKR